MLASQANNLEWAQNALLTPLEKPSDVTRSLLSLYSLLPYLLAGVFRGEESVPRFGLLSFTLPYLPKQSSVCRLINLTTTTT